MKWGYSLGYYIISATWGYLILRKIPDFPTWLGGTGSLDFFAGMPKFSAATNEMSMFYILQLGKHFSRFFTHVFIRPEGNYYEIALHHGLSVFLIAFSYLTNLWFIGIFVLVLHDFSDFWLIFSRAYKVYCL